MSFLPTDENQEGKLNMAPMIDFLFLMVVFFATLAVSRVATQDTDIDLVKVESPTNAETTIRSQEQKLVHLVVTNSGEYKWVTEIHDYSMKTSEEVKRELLLQHERGLLPGAKAQTKVLVKVDRAAKWEPILKLLLSVKEAGFEVRPVYEPLEGEG